MMQTLALTPTPTDIQKDPVHKTVKRNLCVHIEGSLTDMAHQGIMAALWKASNGTESQMFRPTLEDHVSPEHNATIIDSLRNCIIKKVTLKEQKSSFPMLLGVHMNCIPCQEVNNLGEKYAYTVLPHSTLNAPQVVYECDASTVENSMWQKMYAGWNNSNLETLGIMDVPNHPFCFVLDSHPAVGVMRFNENLLGSKIDAQQKLEGKYFKVSKQVLSKCCDAIREEFLNNSNIKDLSTFNLQLKPLNNKTWDDLDTHLTHDFQPNLAMSEQENMQLQQLHIKNAMTKPCQYMARIEVEYDMPVPNTSSLLQ